MLSEKKEQARQALIGMSTEANPVLRTQYENFINEIILSSHDIVNNVRLLTELVADKRLTKIVLVLLKKMLKTLQMLEEKEAFEVFYLILQNAFPVIDMSNLKILSDLVVAYLYQVMDISSPQVLDIYQMFLNELVASLQSQNIVHCCFFLSNFSLFTKMLNDLKIKIHLVFTRAQQTYQPTFDKLVEVLATIDTKAMINTDNFAFIDYYFRVLQSLTIFYNKSDFLAGCYSTFYRPLLQAFISGRDLNSLELAIMTRLCKAFSKCYLVLINNCAFFNELSYLYFEIFFEPVNYKVFAKSPANLQIAFQNLSLFISIVEDFVINGDFSINVTESDMKPEKLEDMITSRVHQFLEVVRSVFEAFVDPTMRSILSSKQIGIKSFVEHKNKNFKTDPFECGLKFIRVLNEFYWKTKDVEIEELTLQLVRDFERQVNLGDQCLQDVGFYYQLIFVEDNLFRVLNLVPLDFIIFKILSLNTSQLNFFLLKFCESYFAEYQISDQAIEAGIQFCYGVLAQATSDLQKYIAINIILLIRNKMVEVDEARVEVNFVIVFESFYQLLQSAEHEDNEETDLFCLIDLFEEIARAVEANYEQVSNLISFILRIAQTPKWKNQLETLQKIAEIYSNILLDLPNESLTLQVFNDTIFLIENVLQKYQASQEHYYLSVFAKLTLYFIFKFEPICDKFIAMSAAPMTDKTSVLNSCGLFLEFINRVIYPVISTFVEQGMFTEIILILFAMVNVFSKMYIVVNFENLKPVVIQAHGSFVTDIMLTQCAHHFPSKIDENSTVRVYINDANFEVGFLLEFLERLSHIVYQFVKSNNIEFYKNCLDVLEFFMISFPFLNAHTLSVIFRSFDILGLNQIDDSDESKVEIFISLARLMARVIFFHPHFLLQNKPESFGKIIEFVKHINFSGKYQENLSMGILIRECIEILCQAENQDLVSVFASLQISDGGQVDQQDSRKTIAVLLKFLTAIMHSLNNAVSFFDDLAWENIKYILLSEPHYERLVS
jgi:hypothetical protein